MDAVIRNACIKQIKSLKVAQLDSMLSLLSVASLSKKSDKTEAVTAELLKLEPHEIVNKMRQSGMGLTVEVKELLDKNIEVKDVAASGLCGRLDQFIDAEPNVKARFVKRCDLVLNNDVVTSTNCAKNEVQGLYMLTMEKDGVTHIVKMGSFAETQGMAKRIASFGGGCYETGSLTNKWFQRFMKKALVDGYACQFVYYENEEQVAITTTDLDGNPLTTMPYVMRPKETQLFDKYNAFNGNIPPIFGSNCSKK